MFQKSLEKIFVIIVIITVLCLPLAIVVGGNSSKNDYADIVNIESYKKIIEELRHENDSLQKVVDNIHKQHEEDLEWYIFKLALIKVESNFNPEAVNRTSRAGGLFQIMPNGGFLQEANRLIGIDAFTDSCRFDTRNSNQIFEVVNSIRNPERNIEVAIKLHNPRAGEWYRDRIMNNFFFFKELAETNY